jgi:tetratricopeptide (TPR) repeat protein
MGNVATALGNYAEAKQLLQQAVALFKATGDPRSIAMALSYLSPVAHTLGHSAEAKQLLYESLTLSRNIGDRWSTILSLNHLGVVTYQVDAASWPEAKRLHEESLAISKELGDRREIAVSLNYLGDVTCALEQYPEAQQHYLESLQLAIEGQMMPIALDALVGLANMLSHRPAAEGKPGETRRHERAVELLALVLMHPASGREAKDRAQHLLSELQAELPPHVLAALQERGQARNLADVVAELLAE